MVQALGPEEALGNLMLRELRGYCSRFGLKTAGQKLDLIGRLGEYLKASAKERSVAPCQMEDLVSMVQALGPEEALGNLRIGELKEYCLKLGVKRSGPKLDLIGRLGERLEASVEQKSTDPAEAPRNFANDGLGEHRSDTGRKPGVEAS